MPVVDKACYPGQQYSFSISVPIPESGERCYDKMH